jgi:hypothetical protein
MDPTVRAIFFLVAVVFLLAGAVIARPPSALGLGLGGLALFVFPFMWDAFEAA